MSFLDFLFGSKKRQPVQPMPEPDDSEDLEPIEEHYKEYERLRRKRRWLLVSLGGTVFLIAVMTVYYYNYLTTLYQAVLMSRADIAGCLQMRENLIPVLFKTVSDFVKHEDDIFLSATEARARSMGAKDNSSSKTKPPDKGEQPQDSFSGFLSRLFAVAERYPDLQTSPSFQILMTKVGESEQSILDKRIKYNDTAYQLNRALYRFPGNAYGWVFDIGEVAYFEWKEKPEWVSTLKQD